MNRPRPTQKRRRSYNNALRQEQAEMTRNRVLEALLAELSENGWASFSMARLAKRAKVSEPTIYRHFESREKLLEAASEFSHQRLGGPASPQRVEELPAFAIALCRYFDANAEMVRGSVRATAVGEIRDAGRKQRDLQQRELMADYTDHLGEKDAEALVAVFRRLMRAETWVELVDDRSLPAKQASDAMSWAVAAFVEKLQRDRAERRTALVDDEVTIAADRFSNVRGDEADDAR